MPARRIEGNADHSFPSEYRSSFIQSASFIQKRYGQEYGIPAYIVASVVGYSRDEGDKHHVHDIIAGDAIDVTSLFYFTSNYIKSLVVPFIKANAFGFRLGHKW